MLKALILLLLTYNLAFSGNSLFKESAISNAHATSDTLVCTLGAFSTNGFYSQPEDSAAKIYEESNGNQYVKLTYDAVTKCIYSSFYIINSEIFSESGTYMLEFDIRFNADFETNNFFYTILESSRSSRAETATMAASKDALEEVITEIPNSSWRHAMFPIILSRAHARDYDTLKIGFNTMKKENNFIDIDNISLRKGEDITFNETVNVNEYIEPGLQSLGDFEDVPAGFPSPTNSFSVEFDGVSNHYGKLNAINGVSIVNIYAKDYMSANRRTFEFKVKKGPAFSGTLQLYASDTSTNPTFDLSNASVNEWVVVSGRYNVKDTASEYLSLQLTSTNNNPDNYLLIDDIYALYGDERNLINVGADFEAVSDKAINGTDWFYNQRLHIDAPDTKVVYEGGGKALKVYKDAISTNFTLKLNPDIYETGWYKLTFKLKGGSNFYTNNIGYRLYASTASFTNKAVTGDTEVVKDNEYLSFINKWGEVDANFYINANEEATYLGLNIWVFFHNNNPEYQSDNNYCLFDDIEIYKQNPTTGEMGPNLIDENKRSVSGFNENQGIRYEGFLNLDEYDYTKTIIDEKSLEQFNENYVFSDCSKLQNYWG